MRLRQAWMVGASTLLLAAPGVAAPPAKGCEVVAYLIQQARIDFALLKGKQVAKGRCTSRGSDFACYWAFPGDGFGYAEEEAARLKACVAAYPGARQITSQRRAAEYLFDPDVNVAVPAPEIDGNGNWAVGFKIKLVLQP